MKGIFWQEIRRAFSWRMLLAIALVALCIPLDHGKLSPDMSIYYLFFHSITFAGLFGRYFLAMFCALPASTGFLEDFASNMVPYALPRTKRWKYLASKFAASALSGALACALGQALIIAILSFSHPALIAEDVMEGFWYVRLVTPDAMAPFYAYTLYYAALTGMMYSSFATMMSTIFRSALATVISPYIGAFLLAQGSKLLKLPTLYRFDYWLAMRACMFDSERWTALLALGCVAALLGLFALVFMRRGRRMIEHG